FLLMILIVVVVVLLSIPVNITWLNFFGFHKIWILSVTYLIIHTTSLLSCYCNIRPFLSNNQVFSTPSQKNLSRLINRKFSLLFCCSASNKATSDRYNVPQYPRNYPVDRRRYQYHPG